MVRKTFNYFLAGLVIVLPTILTVSLIFYLMSYIDTYFRLRSTLLILVGGLVGITMIGFIARKYVEAAFWKKVEGRLITLPILGLVYKAVKDVTTALIGRDRKFSEPVMVQMHGEGIHKIGFVTNKDVSQLLGRQSSGREEEDLFLVYFPLSFSLSGDLFLVERKRVQPLRGQSKEVMQTIVSGGIIKADASSGT